MTIKELWDKYIPDIKSKLPVKFQKINGEIIAVDISL